MDQQFEKDMMDEMERRYLNELQFDEYLQSLKQTARPETGVGNTSIVRV